MIRLMIQPMIRAMAGRLALSQALLRLVMLLAPVTALTLTAAAGPAPAASLVVLVLVVSAVWAVVPESTAGSAALLLVLFWWGVGLREGLHPAALGAAALLLAAHLAALLTAYGPGTMPLDGGVARRWAARGALVLLVAPAVLWLLVLVRDRGEPPGIWLAGLVALLLALLAATVLHARRAE